jgi:hypothetical protein
MLESTVLLKLYLPLVGWVSLGYWIGGRLPKAAPAWLGHGLFWVGVPLSILAFLRQVDLTGSVWLAPLLCWTAIALAATLSWSWLKLRRRSLPLAATQGSFLIASMFGNTGYLGYPVILAVVDPKYFGWAVFYDTIGGITGAYGLGVILASRFGSGTHSLKEMLHSLVYNPALWSFGLGLGLRQVSFPTALEQGLKGFAWGTIALSLILIGMRLSQIRSWQNARPAVISLSIKMLIVPLLLGMSLPLVGITGPPQLIMVLQMSMPPAFATLVLAETFGLDRDLTITALVLGSIGLLATLPVWLWLFGS